MIYDTEKLKITGIILKQLRHKSLMSLRALSEITEISPSTLSRIEEGIRSDPGFLSVLSRLYGIPEELLTTIQVQGLPAATLILNIDRYIKENKKEAYVRNILAQSRHKQSRGPAYLLQKAIDEGYLNTYRFVSEIRAFIHASYGQDLKPSRITKALMRADISKIEPAKGKFRYKLNTSVQAQTGTA